MESGQGGLSWFVGFGGFKHSLRVGIPPSRGDPHGNQVIETNETTSVGWSR